MNSCNTNRTLSPAASIIERTDGYLIEADLPGVSREGIQLSVEDDILTITGKRAASAADKRAIHRETSRLDYQRAFTLGRQIDRGHVSARFESGVLQVFLPKSEALKPRRIDIAG